MTHKTQVISKTSTKVNLPFVLESETDEQDEYDK
jgi:hypothetical protein